VKGKSCFFDTPSISGFCKAFPGFSGLSRAFQASPQPYLAFQAFFPSLSAPSLVFFLVRQAKANRKAIRSL